MTLEAYFEEHKGFGVLSTADGEGRVNAAVYSRPHVMGDGTVAFIMWDRLTHANLQSNPHAVPDGAGGAVAVWQDERLGGMDIYCQRIDAGGSVQWAVNGVSICSAAGLQTDVRIVEDGSGGAFA